MLMTERTARTIYGTAMPEGFKMPRKGADKHFMPSIVIRSDSGQTKHLAISWEEFKRVVALLTEG